MRILRGCYELEYKAIPARVDDFIKSPRLLGVSTANGRAIYPKWKTALKEIFSTDEQHQVVFTGSIGIGKTTAAIIGMLYVIYRILHLKDPWRYFGLADGGKMVVSFFNLTKSLSQSKGFNLLMSYMIKSPWFRQRGHVKSIDPPLIEIPLFDFVLASPYSRGFGIQGANVITGIMDEVDSPLESEKQKLRVLKAYEATVRRFESRFVVNGLSLGKLFLVASKQDELSFLEAFIEERKSSEKVIVFDFPLWEVKDVGYSGEKFYVNVGNKYVPPKILETKENVDKAKLEGFTVIEVPVEHREEFERDIIGSLRDLAGISVRHIRKAKLFPAEKFVDECWDEEKEEPVSKQTIEMGLEDKDELMFYIDVSKIRMLKEVPRAVHLDIALSGDAAGLAMSGVAGWTEVTVERQDGTFATQKVPVVETDFVMRLKAREGDELPLFKIRKFVLWLKEQGFNIVKFTADLRLASADTLQILQTAGLECQYKSVDRSSKPYLDFRDMVFEKRWVCHRNEYLRFELTNLEYDRETNKIDHPKKVKEAVLIGGEVKEVVLEGSKDMADAVCGSVTGIVEEVMRNPPMDSEMMKNLLGRFGQKKKSSAPLEKQPFWWVDEGGKKVEGVAGKAEGLGKLADLMRKRRRKGG